MGLIKSIFGAIFGLIGGIFKTVGGLVGLGKKSEFFMELNDAGDADAAALTPVGTPETAPAANPETAAAAPAKATKAPAKAKAPAQQAAPAPAVVAPAEPVPTGFASNYLTSVGTTMPSRRRPGPSLSPFKDMAKQVKR